MGLCGPSKGEKAAQGNIAGFSTQLMDAWGSLFGMQSAEFKSIGQAIGPTIAAGPDQQGWGAKEAAAVNTQIGEGVGENYAKASKALNNQIGARGGGNQVLPSGAADQLKEQLAASASSTLSKEQLAATEANYAQGRTNFENAITSGERLASEMNPSSESGGGISASEAAFKESEIMNAQSQAWEGPALGLVGAGVSMLPGGSAIT